MITSLCSTISGAMCVVVPPSSPITGPSEDVISDNPKSDTLAMKPRASSWHTEGGGTRRAGGGGGRAGWGGEKGGGNR